jgi:integral membrane protein (TIGR00529 family)
MDPVLSVFLVLLVMVVAIQRKVDLNVTILLGVLLASALFGRIALFPSDAFNTLLEPDTISLILMVYFVFLLNNVMSEARVMQNVTEALERAISDRRIVVATIPALIGLIPSPSGAVLSAPFVDEVGGKALLSKEKRLLINYWFRHVSEYINPIYPGVLVATSLLGVSFRAFFMSNLPVSAVYVLTGIVFYLLTIPKGKEERKKTHRGDAKTVLAGILPILIAVALPVILKVDLSVALIVAIVLAWAFNHKVKMRFGKLLRESLKLDLIVLVFLVMLFKTVLEQSNAASLLSDSLSSSGVPTLAVLAVIPAVVGFLTGLTIGYVGLAFPVLMPMLSPGGIVDMRLATFAFVCGYIGVLLSPMHLCFSVTQKYFKADMKKSYRLLLPGAAVVFAFTLAYVMLVH